MKLETTIRNVFDLKREESILIVTDKNEFKVAKKFFIACKKLSKNVKIISKPVGKYDSEEPSEYIAREMSKSDVVIAITTHSLTHTYARKNACKKGARIATLPGFTEKMFPALFADVSRMKKDGERLAKILRKTNWVQIKTKSGTDIKFSVKGRLVFNEIADLRKKGSIDNLPAGEVSLSPVEGTANGIISIDTGNIAKQGTKILVYNGWAIGISDRNCKLAEIFNEVENSQNIAELGIGTNPKARLIGKVLLDEKVKGTCHIAFGTNISYGGKVKSGIHLDTILLKPTIIVDGKIMMKDGKL